MDRTAIVQGAANQLFAAEDAVDQAISRAAHLMEALIAARRDLDLPEAFGDEAFHRVGRLIGVLAEARREAVGAHLALDHAQAWMGVKVTAFGAAAKPDGDRHDPSLPRAGAAAMAGLGPAA
jgi:hypothetical protein